MPLREPIAVYVAANSIEAHFLCGLLLNCGIDAIVAEGLAHHGESPPTILIDRSDVERARPIFLDFEQRLAERHAAAKNNSGRQAKDESVIVTCEECGVEASFPAAQYGLIQNCPRCRAYIDVFDIPFDDWDVAPE